jgi:hypothetical protein
MVSHKKDLAVLKKEEVLFAQRIAYRHYGIYSGRKKVIHYARKESAVRSKVTVLEQNLVSSNNSSAHLIQNFIAALNSYNRFPHSVQNWAVFFDCFPHCVQNTYSMR